MALAVVLVVAQRLLAQSVFFSDPLTGPASPNLTIPVDKYGYTPAGLVRTSATGSELDRPVVRTASGAYLATNNFVAEVTVTVKPKDLVFFGFGQGTPNGSYYNEPDNGFLFRIHNWDGYYGIDASVTKCCTGDVFLDLTHIADYNGGPTTFRFERNGDSLTMSVPAQPGASRTYSISQYAAQLGLTNSNTYFYFGNTGISLTGTTFSDFKVTPGAGPTNEPPSITSLSASPSSIWPPNGKMVPVTLQVAATGTPTLSCAISSVSANEASARPGPMWTVTGPLALSVSADRLGSGTGRIYSVVVTCTNSAGSSSSTVTISVPHDQRK